MRSFLSVSICLASIVAATSLHAAEWRECEKAKLQQLRLAEQARSAAPVKQRTGRHRASGGSRRQSAEEVETWLWKNCREYSYELRALEQQKM